MGLEPLPLAADRESVRSQLRLRILLPLVAVAVMGLGVSRFALGGSEEPVPAPDAAVTLSVDTAEAVAPPEPAPASPDEATEAGGETKPSAEKKFRRAIKKHDVLVAIFYSRDSDLDDLATREARAGAKAAGAGFIAIDVLDEDAAKAVATDSNTLRDTPTVLVFTGTTAPVSTLYGYSDRETVAQAADNAEPAS
jgi:hypothetical protein